MLFRNYILTIANAYRRLLKEKRYMLFKLYFIGACFFFFFSYIKEQIKHSDQ